MFVLSGCYFIQPKQSDLFRCMKLYPVSTQHDSRTPWRGDSREGGGGMRSLSRSQDKNTSARLLARCAVCLYPLVIFRFVEVKLF